MPGGFIGVDVFFVLSGYLISGLLLRELQLNARIDFMSFYARRLKRLLPALVVMLSVSFGLALWLLSTEESRAQLASSPFVAFWLSNLYFTFVTFDYFDELGTKDLFLHTWSLGVEEQFYLIWPLLILVLFRLGNRQQGNKNLNPTFMLLSMITAFILSLWLCLYWSDRFPQAAFYLMPSRVWQFALGAIVYVISDGKLKDNSILTKYRNMPGILLSIGMCLIVGSSLWLHPDLVYPGYFALLPSIGAMLVILAGSLSEKSMAVLNQPVLVWLGDRSYSLYLWHWPIFILGFSMGYKGLVIPTIGMAIAAVLAASLNYRLIELPFWKGKLGRAKPRLILLLSLLFMLAMVLISYQTLRQDPELSTVKDIGPQWRNDIPQIYRQPCDAWYANARVEPCLFGLKTAKNTVVFLGDSIGAQWFSMIPALFPEPVWRVLVYTKSSCAMVDEDYFYPRIGKIYQVCTDWRNAVLDELDKLKPDIIIMGSAATYGFNETQWVEGSSRVLSRVSSAQKTTIFVIPGTPSLGFDGPGCISRNFSAGADVDRERCSNKNRMKNITTVVKYLEQAVKDFPNVHLLDLNELVCPKGTCYAFDEQGVVIFRDSQHLTDTFVRTRIPAIMQRIAPYYKGVNLSAP